MCEGAVEIACHHRLHREFAHFVSIVLAIDPHYPDLVFAIGLLQEFHPGCPLRLIASATFCREARGRQQALTVEWSDLFGSPCPCYAVRYHCGYIGLCAPGAAGVPASRAPGALS